MKMLFPSQQTRQSGARSQASGEPVLGTPMSFKTATKFANQGRSYCSAATAL
jgi:hypothetical protein